MNVRKITPQHSQVIAMHSTGKFSQRHIASVVKLNFRTVSRTIKEHYNGTKPITILQLPDTIDEVKAGLSVCFGAPLLQTKEDLATFRKAVIAVCQKKKHTPEQERIVAEAKESYRIMTEMITMKKVAK